LYLIEFGSTLLILGFELYRVIFFVCNLDLSEFIIFDHYVLFLKIVFKRIFKVSIKAKKF